MIRTHDGSHGDDCFGCKVRTVQLAADPFQPHFNYATGQYVRNRSEFESALRRGADDNSRRTGIDHDYRPLYPGDVARPSKDDAIFEVRERAIRDGVAPPAPDPNPSTINYDRNLSGFDA
jgi:hypothetical protein